MGAREAAARRRTREPPVAAALLAVYRALHRAQHKRRGELARGAPARCGNRLLERMLASREKSHGIVFGEPGKLLEDGHELSKPLQVGCLVNAVDAGKLRSGCSATTSFAQIIISSTSDVAAFFRRSSTPQWPSCPSPDAPQADRKSMPPLRSRCACRSEARRDSWRRRGWMRVSRCP